MHSSRSLLSALVLAVAFTGGCDPEPPEATPRASGVRTLLACPGPQSPLVLATGTWHLAGACSVTGLHLSGDADVLVTGPLLLLDGDLLLEDTAVLTLAPAELVIPQVATGQHRLETRDQSMLDVQYAHVITSAPGSSSPTAFLDAFGDSVVRFTRCTLETQRSWFLAYMNERSQLLVHDNVHVPTEAYPRDESTIQVTGPSTKMRVVLLVQPDAVAEIDDIPTGSTFSYQFGRGTPGNQGIDYLVDVQNSWVRWGISSGPRSHITVRDNGQPITLSFLFAAVTTPSFLAGLRPGGPLTQLLDQQNRTLQLENVELYPTGWQVYVETLAHQGSARTVSIDDSQINELGALQNGLVDVRNSWFQYAYLAAFADGSQVRVEDTVINSQNVRASGDGVLEVVESSIFGSLLDAADTGRLRLTNTELRENVCHPGCVPTCFSFTGGDECNGFNPLREVRMDARDASAILGARLAPIDAPVVAGSVLDLVGDAYVESPLASLASYTWELSVRSLADAASNPVASGGAPAQIDALLGSIDTTGMQPGEYLARLELTTQGEAPLAAERFFLLVAP